MFGNKRPDDGIKYRTDHVYRKKHGWIRVWYRIEPDGNVVFEASKPQIYDDEIPDLIDNIYKRIETRKRSKSGERPPWYFDAEKSGFGI